MPISWQWTMPLPSRDLYPVTAQNQSEFSGQADFLQRHRSHSRVGVFHRYSRESRPTYAGCQRRGSLDGSEYRTALAQVLASSVSGFLFTGNAGNPITGFTDALGNAFSDWGSTSSSVEGFFDLAGLQPPGTGAQYQLSIEALDPLWSAGVGSYSPGPVAPSGNVSPITVTVTPGNDVEQDILMVGSAQPMPPNTSSWSTPAALPSSGGLGFVSIGLRGHAVLHRFGAGEPNLVGRRYASR